MATQGARRNNRRTMLWGMLLNIVLAVAALFLRIHIWLGFNFSGRDQRYEGDRVYRNIPAPCSSKTHQGEIPGIRGAYGRVGPSPEGVSGRVYIAGILPNSPENLEHWIRSPKQVDPNTDMPEMSVPESDARDIVAYLFTLR